MYGSPYTVRYILEIWKLISSAVNAGHSCWGILNAPATGKSMAELIVDGAPQCVSLAAFDPARFTHKKLRMFK
jgi:glycine/D-amino acid oxidase-like deaminating enzyme